MDGTPLKARNAPLRRIVVIAHDMRSAHNVGSLLRTAEGLGVECVYLSGYTPYPHADGDGRLPHEAATAHRRIIKTSLGAEALQRWEHIGDVDTLLDRLAADGFEICALEQTSGSVPLADYVPSGAVALLLGREVDGVEPSLLDKAAAHLEIPMYGRKESYNVVQAAAMALYALRTV
jgi:23S rRNA (guanosine2251-2'-O)-methyltransferase